MEIKVKLGNVFDKLIFNANSIFDQFYVAYTFYNLGTELIDQINDEVQVTLPSIGNGVFVESVSIRDVKHFKGEYPCFLVEVFHSKLVQAWQNCLNEIFSIYIDAHISNNRDFVELKDIKVQLRFDKNKALLKQICDVCIDDFEFKQYKDRIKIIKRIFHPNNPETSLYNIEKNITIRNQLQHHNGIVDSKALEKLGKQEIIILDKNGENKTYISGNEVELSFPEFYSFKQSIIDVVQTWREFL